MARTANYVDQDSGNDTTGDGSVGTPWLTINKALGATGITRDTTGGNILHVKGSGSLSATLDIRIDVGAFSQNYPLVVKGYGSTAEDGTRAFLDLGAYSLGNDVSNGYVCWADMDIVSDGSATYMWRGGVNCAMVNCKVHRNSTGTAQSLSLSSNALLENCWFQDMGSQTYAVLVGNYSQVRSCAFIDRETYSNSPTYILGQSASSTVDSCIFKLNYNASSGSALYLNDYSYVANNSIWAQAGTGAGILFVTTADNCTVKNNRIEGFSGTGGFGVEFPNTQAMYIFANNKFYNCATTYTVANVENAIINSGNESGSASLFTDVTLTTDDWEPVSTDFSEEAYPNAFGGY